MKANLTSSAAENGGTAIKTVEAEDSYRSQPAETTKPTSVQTQRLPALDGLRGFAILSVILFHYINNQLPAATGKLPVFLREATSFGWAGVDLFFVLSGFLLTDVALKRRHSSNFLFVFTMRRVLRVLPAYFLFLASYALLTSLPSLSTNSFVSGEQVIPFWFYFTLLQNNYMAAIGHMGNPSLSVTWSLAVEEQFYIVLPIVAVMLRPRRLVYALAVGAMGAIVFRSLHSDWIYRYVLLPCRLDSIAIGGLAACLAAGVLVPFNPTKVIKYSTWIVAVGCVVVAATWGIFGDLGIVKHTMLACICAAIILLVAYCPQHPLAWLFNWAWLRYLGWISYSLYLVHYFILGCFHAVLSGHEYIGVTNMRDILVSLAALMCSLIIATASRLYYEKPFIDYGRRLSYSS